MREQYAEVKFGRAGETKFGVNNLYAVCCAEPATGVIIAVKQGWVGPPVGFAEVNGAELSNRVFEGLVLFEGHGRSLQTGLNRVEIETIVDHKRIPENMLVIQRPHGRVGKSGVGRGLPKLIVEDACIPNQRVQFVVGEEDAGLVKIGEIAGRAEVFHHQNVGVRVEIEQVGLMGVEHGNGLRFAVKLPLDHRPVSWGGNAGIFFHVPP